jgi:hypothetical protein
LTPGSGAFGPLVTFLASDEARWITGDATLFLAALR